MPRQATLLDPRHDSHRHYFNAEIFGPICVSPDLDQQTHRALKARSDGREYFTDITLRNIRNGSGVRADFTVKSRSRESAIRTGAVYLGQLCDLITVVTGCPVRFYLPDDDSSDERIRANRQATSVSRELSKIEWEWITASLAYLKEEHLSRFLAAASWYRKGLLGRDVLDDFCCFWRVIERLASTYADKSSWSQEEKEKSSPRKCVDQLLSDLFHGASAAAILADPQEISGILDLRNKLSHGNIPITPEIIESANSYLKPLESAAFTLLQAVKNTKLDRDL